MNLTVLEGELCHVFPKSAWKEWQRKASRDCQNGCWKWKWVLSGVNILVVNHMVSQKNEKKKNSNLIRQRSDCFDENTINKKMIFLVKPCSLHHFSKMRFIPYFHPSFCNECKPNFPSTPTLKMDLMLNLEFPALQWICFTLDSWINAVHPWNKS